MYKAMIIIISLIFFCDGYDEFEQLMNIISRRRKVPTQLIIPRNLNSFNNTDFCPMPVFYDKLRHKLSASPAEENDFPWIARVFHSQTRFTPFLCTAAAIREKVFITAGVCLATAKVTYTTVEYQQTRLRTKAIVLPNERSVQMFDDIGFIVVKDTPAPEKWSVITPVGKQRTDDHFMWLESWNLGLTPNSSVVGFISQEDTPDKQELYQVEEVYVSNHLCDQLLPAKRSSGDYFVPCYHYCSVLDYKDGNFERRYLRGIGHVVYANEMDGIPMLTLIGVATWSCDGGDQSYLPIGMAIPNSDYFYTNLNCSLKIRDDDGSVKNGRYQTLCDT